MNFDNATQWLGDSANQWLFWANDHTDMVVLASVLISWVAVLVALVCLIKMKRQARNTLALFQRLNQDLQVASSSAVGMGKRIISVERQLAGKPQTVPISEVVNLPLEEVKQPERKPEPVPVPEPKSPFDQANDLLRDGMDVLEVARRCGLSKSEASLMAMMQNRPSSAVG